MTIRFSSVIGFVALVALLLGTSVAFAEEPYYVWTGQLPSPDSVCTFIYDPVVDKDGNEYSNPCFAALDGVRVTYK